MNVSRRREYLIWVGLKTRCYNPKHHSYPQYGGRGILMFPLWKSDFSAFFEHVGQRPTPRHSIDRIDNSKGYEPGNVRWATREDQNNNKKNNVFVLYRGQQMTIAQAAKAAGSIIGGDLAHNRITRYGWSVEKAVESPPKFKRERRDTAQ